VTDYSAMSDQESRLSTALLLGGVAVSLMLALWIPLATAGLALLLFGVWHNYQEFRFLAHQGLGWLGQRQVLLPLLCVFGGIALLRLGMFLEWLPQELGRQGEIACLYVALLGVALGMLRLTLSAILWIPFIGIAAWWSWAHPDLHFVGLAQLHNVIPAILLIGWSRRASWDRAGRTIGMHLVWALLLPILILMGFFDQWITPDLALGTALTGPWTEFARAYVPPSWAGSSMAVRALVVFAFLQLMHYLLWIVWIPRFASRWPLVATPAETPFFAIFRARETACWVGGGGLAIALLMASDFALGRGFYAALASLHAYLEFPLLLFMLTRLPPPMVSEAPATA